MNMRELSPIHPHTQLVDEYQLELHGRLVSYSEPIDALDPLKFVRYFRGRERFFWRDGRNGIIFCGAGVGVNLMGWGETRVASVARQARTLFAEAMQLGPDEPLAAPRLFGGFAFTQEFAPDNAWVGFNPAHFILPHYQLVQARGQTWLTINVLIAADESAADALPELRAALTTCRDALAAFQPLKGTRSPAVNDPRVSYPMPFDAWAEMIRTAQDRFSDGELEKVVLARICELRLPEPMSASRTLTKLIAQYPRCYAFLFEPQPNHAFIGATPELLVRTRGRAVESMGLAGSIQRGATSADDARLGNALLASTKDRHEHELVVAALRRRLRPLTTALDMPATPEVLTLSNIQHLYTPVRGELAHAHGVLPLVETLHPTPALGGAPRAQALAFIDAAEPVPRGWYAAPVGWIDRELDGAFAVAIRSAVAQQRRVWLYAGAGIVADSIPEQEWQETGWKFRPMLDALGANSPIINGEL